MKEKVKFSVIELKQILIDIKEHGPHICIRFRVLGQMWQRNFVRIVNITDDRILVNDEPANKLISIDINNIVQFEIDHAFKVVDPHFHYDIAYDNSTSSII